MEKPKLKSPGWAESWFECDRFINWSVGGGLAHDYGNSHLFFSQPIEKLNQTAIALELVHSHD